MTFLLAIGFFVTPALIAAAADDAGHPGQQQVTSC